MPKVEEGIIPQIDCDETGLTLTRFQKAASRIDDTVFLHCSVKNRSQTKINENGF